MPNNSPLHGTESNSRLRIPATSGSRLEMRFADILHRDRYDPPNWRRETLAPVGGEPGWFEIDLDALGLVDGDYEYEFLKDGAQDTPIADPYAMHITRFGGYRGIFQIRQGRRWRQPFTWEDEFIPGNELRNNHQLVIYEMPMRWMESAPEKARQVGLGTFEKVVFAHLDRLKSLGINAIELLPVQDSPDTLNWGYGTRFFFAPDIDIGLPVELKFFVKHCHRRGIRVIFDVVMNHARNCPLAQLDYPRYFLTNEDPERAHRGEDYGANLFRYWPDDNDRTPARDFQKQMAAYLITEYHADGFRIDEFKGINHWEFIQQFRDHAWQVQQQAFPGRPFIVIAEDSWRRPVITQANGDNPNGRKVTDSMWNFGFRDELRRTFSGHLATQWGEPSRSERLRGLVNGARVWDDWNRRSGPGFHDLSQAVNYLTSHDVEKDEEQRIMNYLLAPLLEAQGYRGTVDDIRWVADHLDSDADERQRFVHGLALERLRSAFCLLLTSVGIPMILAGDEFGDVHDLDHRNWRLKMSDPVDWERLDGSPNNRDLWERVAALIALRTTHPALGRNETAFLHFHPDFDQNQGARVFAFCRTRGAALGATDQVVVIGNIGSESFINYNLPWHWMDLGGVSEIAPPRHGAGLEQNDAGSVRLSLAPYQIRVFT
ncbi:MAG: alpha-amylase family glycosyl hydrolase, partial [Candidatus Thiodiazotropha sp.]